MFEKIDLVFFVYGLAFFSMGVVLLLESGRSPFLAQTRVLIPLALFGFIHGSHEWLEMFLYQGGISSDGFPGYVNWIRLIILSASFVLLILFGVNDLFTTRPKNKWILFIGVGIVLFFCFLIFLDQISQTHDIKKWMGHIDALSRYSLGFTGSILTASAFGYQAHIVHKQGRRRLAVTLSIAAGSFALYGVTQLFVPNQDFFPANIINSKTFLAFFGFPIQIVRSGIAVVVMICMIRAVQLADVERQKQYNSAQQERINALEQLKIELLEREKLRKKFTRSVLMAQEDERTRIARELHDETAQLLTAFNLHLASLEKTSKHNPKIQEQIVNLKILSRQMSEGIYHLVHDLRPAQLDDLGLIPALQYLCEQMRKTHNLAVSFLVEGKQRRLDPLEETVIFRVTQEALTNITRHAGIDQAVVQLAFNQEYVGLTISDEGVGFNPQQNFLSPKGLGLAGMRERVEVVGGSIDIQSEIGKGTKVIVLMREKK
jgi:signal transduction histidine kinase